VNDDAFLNDLKKITEQTDRYPGGEGFQGLDLSVVAKMEVVCVDSWIGAAMVNIWFALIVLAAGGLGCE